MEHYAWSLLIVIPSNIKMYDILLFLHKITKWHLLTYYKIKDQVKFIGISYKLYLYQHIKIFRHYRHSLLDLQAVLTTWRARVKKKSHTAFSHWTSQSHTGYESRIFFCIKWYIFYYKMQYLSYNMFLLCYIEYYIMLSHLLQYFINHNIKYTIHMFYHFVFLIQ